MLLPYAYSVAPGSGHRCSDRLAPSGGHRCSHRSRVLLLQEGPVAPRGGHAVLFLARGGVAPSGRGRCRKWPTPVMQATLPTSSPSMATTMRGSGSAREFLQRGGRGCC